MKQYFRNAPLLANLGDVGAYDQDSLAGGYVLGWDSNAKVWVPVVGGGGGSNVLNTTLTGFSPTIGTVTSNNTVLEGFGILSGNVTNLETRYARLTRFESIGTNTSGTVTVPTNETVVLDDFGGSYDAVVTHIVSGKPDWTPVSDSNGVLVTTTFNSNGNYVLSSASAVTNNCIVFRTQVAAKNLVYDGGVIGPDSMDPAHTQLSLLNADSNYQHISQTQVNALHPAVSVSNTGTINLTMGSNQALTANYNFPANEVIVAKSSGQFTTIQAAINSVTNASATNVYSLKVMPGTYTEDVTLKDYVFLENGLPGVVTIQGKLTATGIVGETGARGFTVSFVPSADNQIGVEVAGGVINLIDIFVSITGSGNYAVTGIKATSGTSLAISNSGVFDRRTGSLSKDFNGIQLNGSGTFSLPSTYVSVRGTIASGTYCLYDIHATGPFSMVGGEVIFGSTSAFAGEVRAFCCESASSSPRNVQGAQISLSNVSGGTGVGFYLNSSGNTALMGYSGCQLIVGNFTNEYLTSTATGDTQKVWNVSTTESLSKYGAGLAVITPYDNAITGFDQWSTVGTNYWSFVPGTGVFTLQKRCTGLVNSAPILVNSTQTISVTNNLTNFIFADSTGTLTITSAPTDSNFSSSIPLFEVVSDGTNYLVKREDHPVSVDQGMSRVWHNTIGTSIANNGGGNLTLLSAANRTVTMVGSSTIHDHGLNTPIPDGGGAAMTFSAVYVGASGTVFDAAGITQIPSKWQNTATTVANAPNNKYVVVRVGALLDNLNSSNPQYFFSYDTTNYGTAPAAATAIAAQSIAPFPSTFTGMEPVQLGYVTLKANGSGAGTIDSVTIAKQVVGNQISSGGGSASAGNVLVDPTSFTNTLTSTNTTVQSALNTLDAKVKLTAELFALMFS